MKILTTESPISDVIEDARQAKKIQFMELAEDDITPYAVVIVATGEQGRRAKEIFQRVVREMNARGAGLIIPGLGGIM